MPFPHHRRYSKLLCFPLLLAAMLQACATVQSKPVDTATINARANSDMIKQSQQAFAERNPMIVSRMGELELTTRMATPAEIPEDSYKIALGSPVIGAGSLALGLMAPPMFASALVVGGVLLIPLGTYVYWSEKQTWDSINGALSHAAFTRALDSSMKDRIGMVFTGKSTPKMQTEMVIQAFGLLQSPSTRQYCFVASARFILSRDKTERNQEQLQITNANKSEDAPPPQCASLDRFAENGARLVLDTLAEYSEVLAAMAVDRILKESEK